MEASRVVFLDAGDTRPGAVGVRLRQLMGGRGATTLRTLAGQDRRSADPARRMRPTRLPVGGALSCRGAAIGRDAPCAGSSARTTHILGNLCVRHLPPVRPPKTDGVGRSRSFADAALLVLVENDINSRYDRVGGR